MISAKKNIIRWNYIKNTTIYQSFIEIKWPIDFRKDPYDSIKTSLRANRPILFIITIFR